MNPQSRAEAILEANIRGEEYKGQPLSRIEELLMNFTPGEGGGVDNASLAEHARKIASADTLGHVRIGDGIDIDKDGRITTNIDEAADLLEGRLHEIDDSDLEMVFDDTI